MKLLIVIGIILLLVSILDWSPYRRDTTDQSGWFGKRSGLRLYTDNATGVQYVRTGIFGGTAIRVDQTGKPLIER